MIKNVIKKNIFFLFVLVFHIHIKSAEPAPAEEQEAIQAPRLITYEPAIPRTLGREEIQEFIDEEIYSNNIHESEIKTGFDFAYLKNEGGRHELDLVNEYLKYDNLKLEIDENLAFATIYHQESFSDRGEDTLELLHRVKLNHKPGVRAENARTHEKLTQRKLQQLKELAAKRKHDIYYFYRPFSFKWKIAYQTEIRPYLEETFRDAVSRVFSKIIKSKIPTMQIYNGPLEELEHQIIQKEAELIKKNPEAELFVEFKKVDQKLNSRKNLKNRDQLEEEFLDKYTKLAQSHMQGPHEKSR